jgi:hypothetical protein
MRLRLILLIVILVLLPVVGAAGYWAYAAAGVKRAITDRAAAGRADGIDLRYVAMEVDGFPLWLRVRLTEPEIVRRQGKTSWHWQGPAITATARPWRASPIRLHFPGEHRLLLDTAADPLEYRVAADAAEGLLALDDRGAAQSLDLAMRGLTLVRSQKNARDEITARSARLTLAKPPPGTAPPTARPPGTSDDPGLRPSATLTLTFAATGLVLPNGSGGALGRKLAKLDGEATLFGSIPPGRPRVSFAAWRQTGGVIDFARLGAVWGPLTLTLNGTGALDAALQPVGAFSGSMRGHDATLEALVAAGRIKRDAARMLGLALNLASRRPADGGPPEVTLPLTIQNRHLYVGPVALWQLPLLVWE